MTVHWRGAAEQQARRVAELAAENARLRADLAEAQADRQTLAAEAGALRDELVHTQDQLARAHHLVRKQHRELIDLVGVPPAQERLAAELAEAQATIRTLREGLPEWQCPACKATTRARLADAAPPGPAAAVALCRWLARLDDPEDVVGREERRTVTLTKIIDRARAALAATSGPEPLLATIERGLFGTTDGDLVDDDAELPVGELRRLLREEVMSSLAGSPLWDVSQICGDSTGPSGVGGLCVLPPGHPHVDGIGGTWPATTGESP